MTATLTRALTFTADAKPFASAVQWAADRTPLKPNLPVLAGVLLTVADGMLTVSSFDYETFADATVDVPGATDGVALVSGRLLAKVADTFRKPIAVTVDGAQLVIQCGPSRVELPTMPAEDYPQRPDMPPQVATVDAEAFARAVKRTTVAVAHGNTLPFLLGLRIRLNDGRVELAATDRHRAVITALPCTSSGTPVEVLPHAALVAQAAPAFAQAGGQVTVHADDNLFGLSGDGRSIATRLIDQEFPKVEQLFPPRFDEPTTVEAADLVEVVKRAELVKDRLGPVILELGGHPEQMGVRGTGDAGKASDVIDCRHHGGSVTLGVNATYLLDAMAACGGDVVELSIRDANKPFLVTSPDDADYRHLIVPIRIG